MNGSPISIILGATALGFAILGSGYLVKSSVDRATVQLQSVKQAVAEAPSAPARPPAREARARPQRPDPDRVYEVEVGRSPVRGPEEAPVTIVEFSDFECPFCRRVTPTLEKIREQYPERVKIAFKHLPLSMHRRARPAHLASEAAHRQGRFWEMHDKIFANPRDLSEEAYVRYAEEIGLDVERFKADMASEDVADAVDADLRVASSLGVTGTPGFFVNGRFLRGAQPYESFKRLIDDELAEQG